MGKLLFFYSLRRRRYNEDERKLRRFHACAFTSDVFHALQNSAGYTAYSFYSRYNEESSRIRRNTVVSIGSYSKFHIMYIRSGGVSRDVNRSCIQHSVLSETSTRIPIGEY